MIDAFSKKTYAIFHPNGKWHNKTKHPFAVKIGLRENCFKQQNNFQPEFKQIVEFHNREVKKYIKSKETILFSTFNEETKAAVVERVRGL